MPDSPPELPTPLIESRIYRICGQKVLLDSDLAELYGVPTGRLNEMVKRNAKRFPEDFLFPLTPAEAREVQALKSQSAILKPRPAPEVHTQGFYRTRNRYAFFGLDQ